MIKLEDDIISVNVKKAIEAGKLATENKIQTAIVNQLFSNAEKLEDLLFYDGGISFTNLTAAITPDEAPDSMSVKEYFLNNQEAEREQAFLDNLDFNRSASVNLNTVRKVIKIEYPILTDENIDTMLDYSNNVWPMNNLSSEVWIQNVSKLAKMTADVMTENEED